MHQESDNSQRQEAVTSELKLIRMILEHLECSFARQEAKIDRQEAKLDRLLEMMKAAPPTVPRTPQCLPPAPIQPQSFTPMQSSFEYPLRLEDMELFEATPSPRLQIQRPLENTNLTGKS